MPETADFVMPSLGADMEAGTLREWRVAPGDRVERGDIVAVVETDKAEVDVEIFFSGVVQELLVEPDTKVPVGTPLARIATEEAAPAAVPAAAPAAPREAAPEAAPPPPEAAPAEAAPPEAAPAPAPPPPPPPPAPAGERRRVSPLARRVAEQLGVDLATVQGTGPGGAVRREDVERAAAGAPPAPPEAAPPPPTPPEAAPAAAEAEAAPAEREAAEREAAGRERIARMRRAIAAAMARSKREIPHYYLEHSIDMSHALAWLGRVNRDRPPRERLLPPVLLLRATALAAREAPEMNGFWRDDRFEPSEAVHVGVAITLRDAGLVAPAVHDVHAKDLDRLMRDLSDLIARARQGTLRSSELSDATITMDSLGERSVERVFGIIYPPQVALVGFGTVVERPWAEGGMLGVRPVISATLSGDHRASDGFLGARFLTAIDRLLQEPERL